MLKKSLLFITFIICAFSVVAESSVVEKGAVFWDGKYWYTANGQFGVTTVVTGDNEIYFDGVAFCSYTGRGYLDTSRICPVTETGGGGGGGGTLTAEDVAESEVEEVQPEEIVRESEGLSSTTRLVVATATVGTLLFVLSKKP